MPSATPETLTVRLFVSTQTYDIPCDPRQPALWLLQQAKNIQRANQSAAQQTRGNNQIPEELEVLYNRTRRIVIDLNEPIGRSIAPMDVIDARTVHQTPDMTSNSALFPWLRTHPGGLQLSDDKMNSSDGLFFQQLYAYTLIGQRTPQTVAQRQQQQKQEAFLELLKAYVIGSFEEPQIEVSYAPPAPAPRAAPTFYRPATPPHNPTRRASDFPISPSYASNKEKHGRRLTEYEQSDSGSDHADENNGGLAPRINVMSVQDTASRSRSHPASPAAANTPSHRAPATSIGSDSLLDEMENVFDIVFKQQAIGMKLGSDETKQYAVVKECLEGMEARRYPEIQNGVVILAVNGQEVSGLGLARVLYRLREAPRPVVVRFGRFKNRGSAQNSLDDANRSARTGTWG
ncbi:hypothetical protein PINS_up008998 [Pythium insidiosum]|nr:hypothetical protein PINS_up008998 [Pythium insidiosum]